ncbi:hypothetical protein C0J52_10666 [Blattella germanica]|nr:hypothetical protein C0J52_10666 [Blattella germanica]
MIQPVRESSHEGGASPEVLEAYLGLEQAIWREENKAPAPGPALSFANARLEALSAVLQAAEERLAAWSRAPTGDESIRQGLYQEEDALLGDLFGEAYGNEEEKRLELELDKLRSYRDTLSGGKLEWHEAATLVQNATELLERAVTCWKQINSQTPETRIHLCIDARNCIQEAAVCVQSAQALLPGVQFPYCTAREINAVLQTIDQSLRKDLADVDRRVAETTEQLRKLRM